jgi:hypothetical protein
MGVILAQLGPVLPVPVSPAVSSLLTAKTFFPQAIAPAFLDGVRESLAIAGAMTLLAAFVSILRGDRYVHADAAEGAVDPRPKAVEGREVGSPPEGGDPARVPARAEVRATPRSSVSEPSVRGAR